MGSTDLPYWHVNVPEADRTPECPAFLRDLTAKDGDIISTPDSQFRRVPSELRRYLAYNWALRQHDHGNAVAFVLRERLGWSEPVMPEGSEPFTCARDVKVLGNDWPYGIDERIVHLVVWTKFFFDEDPRTGHLTPEARAQIEAYVGRVFRQRMPPDNA